MFKKAALTAIILQNSFNSFPYPPPPRAEWVNSEKNLPRGWGIWQPPGDPPGNSATRPILIISLFDHNFALYVLK